MPLYTDRTSIETDWTCPRKRYWYREYNGTGIVPVTEAAPLRDGIDIHAALQSIVQGMPWRDVLDMIASGDETNWEFTNDEAERRARLIGWITAFGLYIWPQLSLEWEPIMVEHELVLDAGSLWVATTADIVLKHRKTSVIAVWDYKSVAQLTSRWLKSWKYASQLQLLMAAVEAELKQPVRYAQVMGIQKGYYKDGKHRHPYVWAYSNGTDWQADYRRDMVLTPTWTYPGGITAWVERLGVAVALEQFPLAAPQAKDDRILAALLKQRTEREISVAAAKASGHLDIDVVFPQNFKSCSPAGCGFDCSYLEACHNETVNAAPLESGLYQPRTPHHAVELEFDDGDDS